MTATVAQGAASIPVRDRLRFVDIARSERIKLTSVRSSVGLLLAIVVLGIGVSVALGLALESGGLPSGPSASLMVDEVTVGTVLFGQLIAGVLGVLVMTGEYSSGTIQSTLTAVPDRLRVLAAKALVLFASTTACALVAILGSWAVTFPMFAAHGIEIGLGAPGVLLSFVGGAVFVGLCAVLGLGIGTALRSVAAGVATVVSVLLALPVVLSVLPASQLVRNLHLLTMSKAGDAMVGATEPAGQFVELAAGYISTGAGWLVAVLWTAAALAIGAALLRRRDA